MIIGLLRNEAAAVILRGLDVSAEPAAPTDMARVPEPMFEGLYCKTAEWSQISMCWLIWKMLQCSKIPVQQDIPKCELLLRQGITRASPPASGTSSFRTPSSRRRCDTGLRPSTPLL